jgi:hypothetical protein
MFGAYRLRFVVYIDSLVVTDRDLERFLGHELLIALVDTHDCWPLT